MGKIVYYKLFDYMNRRGIKDSELVHKKVLTAPTLIKLKKNECIKTETLEKICDYLECQPGDIMEFENSN